ncbi:MAG: 4-hydroxy-tetrahydrodipicolinate reductase [Puniceicoccales bacterium]|jgi:4-hydroxy-tetrahydrodipicolinate reductase|nr:4-hydroxy-tetrahydrodipicolinate reductase [Puniceicoccales bacterium]
MKIALCGSSGKMGQLVIKAARELNHEIAAEITSETNWLDCIPAATDVCIDFSSPAGTVNLCTLAAKLKIPVVIGTTGLGSEDLLAIAECAKVIPILMSSNFSRGMSAMRRIVSKAAEILPGDFDVEIVEKHHSQKKYSPSGTAVSLLNDLQKIRKNTLVVFGRHGESERRSGEICVHSLRGGDTIGDHEVYFLGQGESIEIIHRVTNREIFARGAVLAAEWFRKTQKPGLYDLESCNGPDGNFHPKGW